MAKNFFRAFVVGVSIFYLIDLCLLAWVPFWPTQWWWLANLFEIAPLWILFGPLVLFFFWGILARNKFTSAVNALSALVIFFGIMQFQLSLPLSAKNSDPARTFKIISVNMGNVQDVTRTLEMIAREKPQMVAFQELTPENEEALRINLKASEWDIQSYQNLALASRFPIINVQARNREALGGWGGMVARFQIKTPVGPIYIFNMHLATPRTGIEAIIYERWGGLPEMKRVTQLQEAESAAALNYTMGAKPAIVAGDFNLKQSNPIFRTYWSRFSDAFSQKGFGFGYTKHTRWHGVRIDHILSDKNWKVLNASVGPDLGGDHMPVIAQMVFIGTPASVSVAPQHKQQAEPHDRAVFIWENFENSPGRFALSSNAGLSINEAPDNSPSRALKISSQIMVEESMAGIQTEAWNLETFPMMRFAYFIPEGTSVGVRVQTPFGDWVPLAVPLTNDGAWHTAEVNIKESVQQVLRGIKSLRAFQFYIQQQAGGYFWIDDFRISN